MPWRARNVGMAPAGTQLQRTAARVAAALGHVGWLRRAILHPLVARPGYWFATACGLLWGGILSLGRLRRRGGVIVAHRCPRWAFGRGGTTIGAVYLTYDQTEPGVLQHEAVHRAQWRRYGLAFILFYAAAGPDPFTNRFEVEAGLARAGYVRPRSRNGSRDSS